MPEISGTEPRQPVSFRFAHLLMAIAALYLGRELIIPLALAAFLSFLLSPIVRGFERIRFGRVFAVSLTVAGAAAVVFAIGWVVVGQAGVVASDFSRYRARVAEKAKSVRGALLGLTGSIQETIEAINKEVEEGVAEDEAAAVGPAAQPGPVKEPPPLQVEVVDRAPNMAMAAQEVLNPLMFPAATAGAAFLFVIFFLIYREDLRDRIIRVCGQARIHVTTTALEDSARRVMRYIVAMAAANSIIAILIGGGLYLIGLPNAALWGLLAGLLRFIPYVGALTAAFFPIAQAVAIFDGWWEPVAILGWILAVDVLSANLLEPWLYGSRTGVSPTALVFAFLFWTWLWGAIGLLLATPLTVCLIVLGKHVPAFEAFYILLGDNPVLSPQVRFYQRLLARDGGEATRVFNAFVESHKSVDACDQVVVPALAQLELDRQMGVVDAERIDFAKKHVKELLTALLPAPNGETDADEAAQVILVLGQGSFDELLPALIMVGAPHARIETLSGARLSNEVASRLQESDSPLLVMAAIEPAQPTRFRLLLRRLAEAHSTKLAVLAIMSTPDSRSPRWNFDAKVQTVGTLAELVSRVRSIPSYAAALAADAPPPPEAAEGGKGAAAPA